MCKIHNSNKHITNIILFRKPSFRNRFMKSSESKCASLHQHPDRLLIPLSTLITYWEEILLVGVGCMPCNAEPEGPSGVFRTPGNTLQTGQRETSTVGAGVCPIVPYISVSKMASINFGQLL